MRGIGALGSAAAAATGLLLERLADGSSPPLREALVEALGAIGDPRAVPALADGLPGARGALTRIVGRDLGEDPVAWRDWWAAEVSRSQVRVYRCGETGRLWAQPAILPRACPNHGGPTPECGEAVAVLGERDRLVYRCGCSDQWRQAAGEPVRCPGCPDGGGCGRVAGFERADD